MMRVSSWGRLSHFEHEVHEFVDSEAMFSSLVAPSAQFSGIPYGMGRSYGDVCLNPQGLLWKTSKLDRFISFDESTGCLVCEAGVLLRDIHQIFIPRGWILPVSPGTQWVTVGGAIANDVHGKNHPLVGCFGHHVRRLHLMRTDGSKIECTPAELPGWFEATVGGLGLTGVITQAEIQLKKIPSPWLVTETIPFTGIEEFFELVQASAKNWEYTVAWIDSIVKKTTRGIFIRGNFEEIDQSFAVGKKFNLPPMPFSWVNRLTSKAWNAVYFQRKKQRRHRLMHYESFFYPLDFIHNWNRMYGPKGFFQYQSVVPKYVSLEATRDMLAEISHSGESSFLAVLKTFGPKPSVGMLSFPHEGASLAIDFPNRGVRTETLFKRLDRIVDEAEGRIYMAKDARMPRTLFEKGYPRFAEFLPYRDLGISSAMSRRLMGS